MQYSLYLLLRRVEVEEKPKATAKKRQGLVVKEGYTNFRVLEELEWNRKLSKYLVQRKPDGKVCFVHQRKLSLLPWSKKAVAVLFVGESSNSCKRRFPPHSTSHFSLVNQP